MAIEYMHVCSSQGSQVKLYNYPRVCGSEVLCLLSRSGWARFLRPVGTDHRVRALTVEADPFVQDETLRWINRSQE